MGRRPELDALRGLMLVWIALTHLPTSASTYVNQPFGFVSAAEGFIFLSALFTGRIYFRMAEHDGYWPMTRKLWTRTLRLYGYHALLLAFMFLVASTALLLARKIGWKPMLLGGFVIWGFAQFGFRNAEHSFMMRFIPTRIPLNEMGSFDLWAWQFLWISGIWLGVRWGQDNLPIEKWARRVVIPSVLIVVPLFALRRVLEHGFELGASEFLFDKWHLGPLRVLNFAAVGALLIFSQSVLKPLAIRPLVMLGQSSLQVFCVHLLFCFAGLTLMGNASMLNGWRQAGLLTATFSAMLLTAKVFSKSEAKHERQPKTKSPAEPGTQTESFAQTETTPAVLAPLDAATPAPAASSVK